MAVLNALFCFATARHCSADTKPAATEPTTSPKGLILIEGVLHFDDSFAGVIAF